MSLALFGFDELEAKLYYLNTGKHISENLHGPTRGEDDNSSSSSNIMAEDNANQGEVRMEEDSVDEKVADSNVRMMEDISDVDSMPLDGDIEDMEVIDEVTDDAAQENVSSEADDALQDKASNEVTNDAVEENASNEVINDAVQENASNEVINDAVQENASNEVINEATVDAVQENVSNEVIDQVTDDALQENISNEVTKDPIKKIRFAETADEEFDQNRGICDELVVDEVQTHKPEVVASTGHKSNISDTKEQASSKFNDSEKENGLSKRKSGSEKSEATVAHEMNLEENQTNVVDTKEAYPPIDVSSMNGNDHDCKQLVNGTASSDSDNSTSIHNGASVGTGHFKKTQHGKDKSDEAVRPTRRSFRHCFVKLQKVELPAEPVDLLKSCKDCYVRLNKLHLNELLLSCRQCSVVVPKLARVRY